VDVEPFDCIIGYIISTSLIGIGDENMYISDLVIHSVVLISPDTALLRLLELFRVTDSQIAIISNKTSIRVDIVEGHNIGIVTRSDLLKYICINKHNKHNKQKNAHITPNKHQNNANANVKANKDNENNENIIDMEMNANANASSYIYSGYQYNTPTKISTKVSGTTVYNEISDQSEQNEQSDPHSDQSFISPVSKGFVFRNNRYMNKSHTSASKNDLSSMYNMSNMKTSNTYTSTNTVDEKMPLLPS